MNRRWLIIAALATAVLIWLAPEDNPGSVVAPVARRTDAGTIAPATADHGVVAAADAGPICTTRNGLALPVRVATTEVTDLFRAATWYVPPPPPPPAKPEPPPPPTAPALPFTYVGQYRDEGSHQIMLARGNRLITVAVGDNIDRNYRLEGLDNGVLTILYVPLDIRQTLTIGNAP